MWDVGSSSLTGDQTQVPCIGSVESEPLDQQGSPFFFFLRALILSPKLHPQPWLLPAHLTIHLSLPCPRSHFFPWAWFSHPPPLALPPSLCALFPSLIDALVCHLLSVVSSASPPALSSTHSRTTRETFPTQETSPHRGLCEEGKANPPLFRAISCCGWEPLNGCPLVGVSWLQKAYSW